MRLYSALTATLLTVLSLSSTAQNHYVVEYDRIHDEVRYFQVFVEHGKLTEEVPVKHIAIQEGDILQARMTNVNPIAFETNLEINEVERPVSPLAGISKLFGGIYASQGILGSISSIIEVSNAEYGGLSRGAGDNLTVDDQMANLLSEIQLDLSNAESFHTVIAEELPATLRAPDLTKAEIQERLTALENKVSAMNVDHIYDDIDEEVSELNALLSSAEFGDQTLKQSAEEVIGQWEDLQLSLEDDMLGGAFEDAALLLEEAEFEHTDYYVVKELDEYNPRPDVMVDFSFSTTEDDELFGEATIYNHKMVRIKRKKPALRIVNGLAVNLPMTNTTSYDVVQRNDSVSFVSSEATTSLHFSTMVQYEFASEGSVAPSLNVGISLPIRNFTDVSLQGGMRILTGAGLHFRSLPNLSFNAGIAWGINDVLSNDLAYNTPYDVVDLQSQNIGTVDFYDDEFTLQPNYSSQQWSMALSFGLSIMVN